ncbi:MAG: transposase [Taibaiella sp.]|nr:transposase [Taibaiella sp.]
MFKDKGEGYEKVNLYCHDEARFVLFTRNGNGLTAKGVKPVSKFQQVCQSLYLFGAYSPFTGDHFELELPHCNTDSFGVFLEEFSRETPNEFKLILLDNGAFHKAADQAIPNSLAIHSALFPGVKSGRKNGGE